MVEIAMALTPGARFIAFGEPTSSNSAREVRRLFAIVRELKARGCSSCLRSGFPAARS